MIVIDWKPVARGRQEDRGHTVVMVGEWADPYRERAFLKCQCGSIFSAHTVSRAYRTLETHQKREWAILDSE